MRFFKVQLLLKQPDGCFLPAIGTEWYDYATDIVSALNAASKTLHDLSVISDSSLKGPIGEPDSIQISGQWENPSGEKVQLTVSVYPQPPTPEEEKQFERAILEAQGKATIEE